MKRINIEQNTQEWLDFRRGKITGSRLADIIVKRGTGRKLGFYEVLAERVAVETGVDHESPLERGHDLEAEAIALFTEITGVKVKTDCGMWISDESDYIAISPDGEISKTEAVEVKCLSSAKHLQAYFEQQIPSEYEAQVMQYFIVNDSLKKLYFVFYDPRIPQKPLHYIEIERSEWRERIDEYKAYELEALQDIERKVVELTF